MSGEDLLDFGGCRIGITGKDAVRGRVKMKKSAMSDARQSLWVGPFDFFDFLDSTEIFSLPFFYIEIGYRTIFVQHEESRGWKKFEVMNAPFCERVSNCDFSDERNDGKRCESVP